LVAAAGSGEPAASAGPADSHCGINAGERAPEQFLAEGLGGNGMFYVSDALIEEWVTDMRYESICTAIRYAVKEDLIDGTSRCQKKLMNQIKQAVIKSPNGRVRWGEGLELLWNQVVSDARREYTERLESLRSATHGGKQRLYNAKKRQWEYS
jgi:Arc/MetJ-type ribon-helix-helix transcriptional regulator